FLPYTCSRGRHPIPVYITFCQKARFKLPSKHINDTYGTETCPKQVCRASNGEYKARCCYTFFALQLSDLAMKLIGSLTSPYVRKVRVVMAEKKLEYDFVIENVWVPETSIQSHNPLGKIPCLLMDDNGSLFDSRVIVEYLD